MLSIKKNWKTNKLLLKKKNRKQNVIIAFFVFGLLLVLAFTGIISRSLKITRKQKSVIEEQKQLVDEKNIQLNEQNEEIRTQRDEIEAQKEEITAQRDLVMGQKEQIEEIHRQVTDSINYAKRIQEAVLPAGEYASGILGDYFILFKPKDVVSGDFYWATKLNEWLVVTVADCTGHGVPGAFMSMLGISFLNEIVFKKEIIQASKILDNLRESVIEALKQRSSTGVQKDGMDMTLVVINKLTLKMQFAGANNSLYLIRKNTNQEPEIRVENNAPILIELQPDKMPVAIYEDMREYTNQ
jgi:serine phosphatase RsbU (regulator of sigma subunit)